MKFITRLLLVLSTLAALAAPIGSVAQSINPLEQFTATTSPSAAITQRTWGKAIKITGLTTGLCLSLDSNSLLTTSACSGGGGGGGNSKWATSTNSDITPNGGGGIMVFSSSTLSQINVVLSTTTAATSTNFFTTVGSTTNLFYTTGRGGDFTSTGIGTFSNILLVGSSTLQNFTFINATGTQATTTRLYAGKASIDTLCLTADTCRTTWPSGGGAGGTDKFATSSNGLTIFPNTATSLVVGETATSTLNTAFEVIGGLFADRSTTTSATTTSLFSTTASSTNLFFTTGKGGTLTTNGLASLSSLSVGGSATLNGSLVDSAASAGTGGYVLMSTGSQVQWVATSTIFQEGGAKSATNYATVAALPANNYVNGSAGVGATISEIGVGALSVDGVSPIVGDRILVKNEGTAANNGIYTVTATGSGIAVFVLTRATDFNQALDIYPGVDTYILSGNTLASTTWVMTSPNPITVGTTAIVWGEQEAGGSAFTAGSVLFSDGSLFAQNNANLFWRNALPGLGLGTSTPMWTLQVSSSTRSQLTLSDSIITDNHWSFRNAGGQLFLATSSPIGNFATSSKSVFSIDANGIINLSSGLADLASSTIGDGSQGGGLTIFGLATTTNLLSLGSSTLQNFTYVNATGTNSTTTTEFATTASTSNQYLGVGPCSGGNALNVVAGKVTCGAVSASGGGTPNSKWATSTTPDITPNGGGGILVFASSTIGAAAATTTFLGPVMIGNAVNGKSLYAQAGLQISSSTNNFFEVNIQNTSNGNNASSLFTVTNDLGTANTYYGEFGINGSKYSQSAFSSQNQGDVFLTANDGGLVLSTASSTNAFADLRIATAGTASSSIRMVFSKNGYAGIGTTTPRWQLQIGSSTAPQLTLSDNVITDNHWSFRNLGGLFYLASSSPTTFATSTTNAISIDANSFFGVATNTPGSQLSVGGIANFSVATSSVYSNLVSPCFANTVNGNCITMPLANTVSPIPNFRSFAGSSATLSTNTTMTCGQEVFPQAISLKTISINVSSVAVAGNARFGFYTESGATTSVATTTFASGTGVQKFALTTAAYFAPGIYYFCIVPVGGASIQYTTWTMQATGFNNPASEPVQEGTVTVTAGQLPASITPSSITPASNSTFNIRLDNQ